MSVRSRLVLVAAFVFSLAACGGDPPTKEIEQAREAVAQARTSGAAEYAGEEFAAAEQSLRNTDAAVEQHDYRLALNYALDGREHAQTATTQAAAAKAIAKSAAEVVIANATSKLEEARAKLSSAEAARVPARALVEPRTKLGDAAQMLQEAGALAKREDYSAVEPITVKVTGLANGAIKDIEEASQPPARRRR